jgi:hypothetical protein
MLEVVTENSAEQVAQAVMFPACIREVSGSNLGRDTVHPD